MGCTHTLGPRFPEQFPLFRPNARLTSTKGEVPRSRTDGRLGLCTVHASPRETLSCGSSTLAGAHPARGWTGADSHPFRAHPPSALGSPTQNPVPAWARQPARPRVRRRDLCRPGRARSYPRSSPPISRGPRPRRRGSVCAPHQLLPRRLPGPLGCLRAPCFSPPAAAAQKPTVSPLWGQRSFAKGGTRPPVLSPPPEPSSTHFPSGRPAAVPPPAPPLHEAATAEQPTRLPLRGAETPSRRLLFGAFLSSGSEPQGCRSPRLGRAQPTRPRSQRRSTWAPTWSSVSLAYGRGGGDEGDLSLAGVARGQAWDARSPRGPWTPRTPSGTGTLFTKGKNPQPLTQLAVVNNLSPAADLRLYSLLCILHGPLL